jgi:hypothetical protein
MITKYNKHNSGHALLFFYLKHDVSVNGFYLCLQVEPTQLGPIDRASLCLCSGPEDGDRIRSPERYLIN